MIVLRVHPQTEFTTQDALHDVGIRALVPFERKWRRVSRHARRRVPWEYPLFPRYCFAEAAACAASVHTVCGVLSGCSGEAYRLSAAEIEWVCGLAEAPPEAAGEVDLHGALHEGMRVRIAEGPLASLVGAIAAISKGCAEVEMMMFGVRRVVKVPVHALEAA